MLRWLMLSAGLLLTGCAGMGRVPEAYRAVHHFELRKPLTIPAGAARVFVQNGRTKSYSAVDWYSPWCALEVREVKDAPQQVAPGVFRVIRVSVDQVEIARRQYPLMLAMNDLARMSIGIGIGGGWHGAGASVVFGIGDTWQPPETMDTVTFDLAGSQQNVMRLTCGGRLSNGSPVDGPDRFRPDVATINSRILTDVGRLY